MSELVMISCSCKFRILLRDTMVTAWINLLVRKQKSYVRLESKIATWPRIASKTKGLTFPILHHLLPLVLWRLANSLKVHCHQQLVRSTNQVNKLINLCNVWVWPLLDKKKKDLTKPLIISSQKRKALLHCQHWGLLLSKSSRTISQHQSQNQWHLWVSQ